MLSGVMRIGIYGGTFAPIHRGHIAAAEAFLTQMELDLLYVIPAGIPPHKQIDASDDPAHRLAMCELAFAGRRNVIVSDMEIRREGKSYTVDTLRALHAEDRRLFLLMGTDMMLTLDSWRAPEEIFRLCYPIYIRRENDPILEAQIIKKNETYLQKYGKIARRLMADVIELSSTEIRDRVRRGEEIDSLVPTAVADYIREKGLYQ
ncbi:MAG: nicotinate (nicotinamide) nucleotide adenylyltransferase [Ruminococcaceae bacterium]|nr:nicotinate (nicotinamide) nucleotide adenylyltransferase [Oscillospiraceae bacterium]